MSQRLIGWARMQQEARHASAPKSVAFVELITTAALALSTAVAVTAVSIGIARADAAGTIADGANAPFALALLIGLLLSAIAALSAATAIRPRGE